MSCGSPYSEIEGACEHMADVLFQMEALENDEETKVSHTDMKSM